MNIYEEFCETYTEQVNGNVLQVLRVPPHDSESVSNHVATVAHSHYVSPERLHSVMDRLDKPGVARFIRERLPETARARSGDLGEILATEYIDNETSYCTPIKRLRWKDHREMPMRGNDVIALRNTSNERLEFLKCEAKSKEQIRSSVVESARNELNHDDGLPSPHALSFIADRLKDLGQDDLADAIDDVQLKYGVLQNQVEHMLFTLSQNDPTEILRTDLESYQGGIMQNNTGMSVPSHREFIEAVYLVEPHGQNSRPTQ